MEKNDKVPRYQKVKEATEQTGYGTDELVQGTMR